MQLPHALKSSGLILAAALIALCPITAPTHAATSTGTRVHESGLYGVRWDPCRPITFRVLAQGGYRGSIRDLRHAFRIVSAATQMHFVFVPAATAADVTVRWSTPAAAPELAGATAGRTTTTIVVHNGVLENTGGLILLDRTTHLRHGFARHGATTWGQAFLHELGHLVGLDHVSDPRQVMYPAIGPENHRYGSGDLRRLHEVGRAAGCVPGSQR